MEKGQSTKYKKGDWVNIGWSNIPDTGIIKLTKVTKTGKQYCGTWWINDPEECAFIKNLWSVKKNEMIVYVHGESLIITRFLGTYSNGPRDTYAVLGNDANGIPVECLQPLEFRLNMKNYT